MPPKKLDAEKCKEFAKNPAVNPLTGRKIDPDGATAKALARGCEKHGASAAQPADVFQVNDFLYGKHIVFSGFRSKEYTDLLATVNCVVGYSLTDETFMVVAADPKEKNDVLAKARRIGRPIITRERFVKVYLKPPASESSSSESSSSSQSSSPSASSSSSSQSSRKKTEMDRLKMVSEVAKIDRAFAAYYAGFSELLNVASDFKLSKKVTDLVVLLNGYNENINSTFSKLTKEINTAPAPASL